MKTPILLLALLNGGALLLAQNPPPPAKSNPLPGTKLSVEELKRQFFRVSAGFATHEQVANYVRQHSGGGR